MYEEAALGRHLFAPTACRPCANMASHLVDMTKFNGFLSLKAKLSSQQQDISKANILWKKLKV